MKAVILAGGLGTRISEETSVRPKPMVEIGGMPVLWHVMKIYSSHGINEFIICLGYKGYVIKEYFANYFLHTSDVTFDISSNSMEVHRKHAEPWKVTLVDTGALTMTGGRLARVRQFLEKDEVFLMSYGDGVGNIEVGETIEFHRQHGKLATVTATSPPARFGSLLLDSGNRVEAFREKPESEGGVINAGFFVLNKKVLDLISGDNEVWEKGPLEELSKRGELVAFSHNGFWQPMDTLRDKQHLESLWASNRAPWKTWE